MPFRARHRALWGKANIDRPTNPVGINQNDPSRHGSLVHNKPRKYNGGKKMKCLRIFATPDGESHFGEVDIPTTLTRSFPNGAPAANYESSRSAFYGASRVRFVQIPAGAREADFHNPPGRLLAIWLDGVVEVETSDGEMRRVSAGKAVLVEDTHGKGHISRHPPEGQNVIQVLLPHGLDAPSA